MKVLSRSDFDHMCYCPFTGEVRWKSFSGKPDIYFPENWEGNVIDFLTWERMPLVDRITAFYRSDWVAKHIMLEIETRFSESLAKRPVDARRTNRRWLLVAAMKEIGASEIAVIILDVLGKYAVTWVDKINTALYALRLLEQGQGV